MKLLISLFVAMFLLGLTACTSEYEERLKQGRTLKKQLTMLHGGDVISISGNEEPEVIEIYNEIILLAKVSGNEELFLKEVFEN